MGDGGCECDNSSRSGSRERRERGNEHVECNAHPLNRMEILGPAIADTCHKLDGLHLCGMQTCMQTR
jgi:hypothetical protein